MVARLLATAALWVRIKTSLKNTKWATQRSGHHTLACQKNIRKKISKIHGQCCESGVFILDPGSEFFNPGSLLYIKEFKYFKPNYSFISSRKYDPGCSSRIMIFYRSRIRIFPIPDPGFKKAPDPGSGSATMHMFGIWYKRSRVVCRYRRLRARTSWSSTASRCIPATRARSVW